MADTVVLQPLHGHDKVYPKNTPNKGKGMFAKNHIKEGDQIIIEKPLICCQFSWNSLYKYTACDHCLKSLESAEEMARRLTGKPGMRLPHKECCEVEKSKFLLSKCPSCNVTYCCDECRQEAYDRYHRVLCIGAARGDPEHPSNKIDEVWRNMHYPPETATIWLICRMIAMVSQADDPDSILNVYSSFCSNPVNIQERMAHKLLGDSFKENLEMLRNMLVETMYSQKIEQWLSPDGFQSLFAMIGMNGQGIGTSSLSQYVHTVDALNLPEDERKFVDAQIDTIYEDIEKESGQFLNCEGSGLYLTQSCCNHSCDPNAEVTFPYNNSTLVLVALRDIEENEEICISYLDECQRERSRHSRQKILRENYLFQCTCPVCESQCDTADQTSSDDDDDDDDDDDADDDGDVNLD